MFQPIFNQIKFTVTALVLTMGIVSSLSMGSINTQAASIYTCPSGSTLSGTTCSKSICPNNTAPSTINLCTPSQLDLFQCPMEPRPSGSNAATNILGESTKSPLPAGVVEVFPAGYSSAMCTSRPDIYVLGSCNRQNFDTDQWSVWLNEKRNDLAYQSTSCQNFRSPGASADLTSPCPTNYVAIHASFGVDTVGYVTCMKFGHNSNTFYNVSYGSFPGCGENGIIVMSTDANIRDPYNSYLCTNSTNFPATLVTTQATLTSNTPEGYLDGISTTGTASGWATDADVPNTSLDVHFYIDGQAGSNGFVGTTVANAVRPDLPAPYNTGKNGFSFRLPEAYCDGKPHTLYAYAIDAPTYVSNPLLNGSPKAFNLTKEACGYSKTTTVTTVTKTPVVIADFTNGTIKINCNLGKEVIVNSKTVCTFDIGDKTLPDGTKLAIGNGDITTSTCVANGSKVTCVNVSTGTQLGDQPIIIKIGTGDKADTNQKVKVVDAPKTDIIIKTDTITTTVITTDDFKPTVNGDTKTGGLIKVVCNEGKEVVINSTTTCTFDIGNKTLPDNTKIAIGNGDINTSNCKATGSKVTCTNVSTGSEAGDQPLFIKIGNGEKVNTNQKVKVTGDTSAAGSLVRSGAPAIVGTVGALALSGAGFFFYKSKTARSTKMNI